MIEVKMVEQITHFVAELDGPLDVPASLELFRRWGDDGIDRWNGVDLARTLPVPGGSTAYTCRVIGNLAAPILHVQLEDPRYCETVKQAVRSMFVEAPAAFPTLLSGDPLLARLHSLYPGLRPVRQHDLFGALVRSISAQQVNLRWAVTTRRRLAEGFGHLHRIGTHEVFSLSPARLASATVAEIRALQFTARKAEYIIGAAEAMACGHLSLETLTGLTDEEVIQKLTALRGIGVWTAEWILARTLGRPRVVAGDLGVRKAVGLAYQDGAMPSESETRELTAHWGPSAGVGQQLLLEGLASGTL